MSKAKLTAFFAKVDADPALKLQVDAAADVGASLSRHLRG
ncbi:MAG: Nif11 family protein [Cyanobium sp.]